MDAPFPRIPSRAAMRVPRPRPNARIAGDASPPAILPYRCRAYFSVQFS
ncbi:hypothetical protein HMPREF0762_00823 [Slackia exigua ATCC 700122]|uniref:Uncharacterized protein n=1 Tax=Slackia exigua (strain ATCC 700122 / DSM 15923 / CIP 105133 / JCM 11022 / KCTC 5966 / S-7) TaxID=649764 RepID=D0WG73_SLAES|nr:hypothetical protein HMPREF0762_00823 [Slackia exigua ATCC 700122]